MLIEEQCIVPMQHFMLKEIIFRASMSYSDKDFKETVDDWIAGEGPVGHSDGNNADIEQGSSQDLRNW